MNPDSERVWSAAYNAAQKYLRHELALEIAKEAASVCPSAATPPAEPQGMDCPNCDGRGWTSGSAHADTCKGDCFQHGCPVQVQEQCFICGGDGRVDVPDLNRPPRRPDVESGADVQKNPDLDAVCRCGHVYLAHVFGACDVSRGGERVDDCDGFVFADDPEKAKEDALARVRAAEGGLVSPGLVGSREGEEGFIPAPDAGATHQKCLACGGEQVRLFDGRWVHLGRLDETCPGAKPADDVPDDACVFCQIVDRKAPVKHLIRVRGSVIFEPLNPVTPGHMLVVPEKHVSDAGDLTEVTGAVMREAAKYADEHYDSYNLITSAGEAATQSVFHLHVHIVPRRFGDGLALPWTPQQPVTPGGSDDAWLIDHEESIAILTEAMQKAIEEPAGVDEGRAMRTILMGALDRYAKRPARPSASAEPLYRALVSIVEYIDNSDVGGLPPLRAIYNTAVQAVRSHVSNGDGA